MSKKTKTTSDSHTVMTPTNPTQVTSGLTGMADKINGLQNMDPYSFTAGPNDLQTQAAGSAAGLGGASNGNFQGAEAGLQGVMNGDAPSMTAATANPYIHNYMDPYLNDVVNTSLASFDRNAGTQQAQARLDQAQDTTFGGSGGSIELAKLLGDQGLNRAGLDAGLRSQGWNTALGAAQEDANRSQEASRVNAGLMDSNLSRRLAAAGQFGQLGLSRDENARANISTQGSIGEAMRQIQLQHNLAPLSTAGTIAGLWGSTPFGLLHGEDDVSHSTSTSKTSDPMGTAAGLLGAAGSFATGLGALGAGGGLAGLFGGAGAAGAGAGGLGGGFNPAVFAKYGQ